MCIKIWIVIICVQTQTIIRCTKLGGHQTRN